jgi:hypothetical protein
MQDREQAEKIAETINKLADEQAIAAWDGDFRPLLEASVEIVDGKPVLSLVLNPHLECSR